MFVIVFYSVAVLSSVMATGINNGVLPGLLSRYTGARGLSVAALILTPFGYFLTWHSFNHKQFYRNHYILIILYYALTGKCICKCIFYIGLCSLPTCMTI